MGWAQRWSAKKLQDLKLFENKINNINTEIDYRNDANEDAVDKEQEELFLKNFSVGYTERDSAYD